MSKKNKMENRDRRSPQGFVGAEEFNSYNVPMPESVHRKRRRKPRAQTQQTQRVNAVMPEIQEAQRKREIHKQRLEELDYVRRAELAREAEAERHRRMQELLRQRELEAQKQAQSGQQQGPDEYEKNQERITLTSSPQEPRQQQGEQDGDGYEQEEMLYQQYGDEQPSFKYLKFKDGKISEDNGQDLEQDTEQDQIEEMVDRLKEEEDRSRNISQQITPESGNVTDIREERKKEKNRRLIKRLVVLGIILALGITAYATHKKWLPKLEGFFEKPHETIVNDGVEEGGNFPLRISQSGISSITQCGGVMVSLDGKRIIFYNPDGSQIKAVAHNYGSPVIDVSEKKILAYDNSGRNFQVLTRKNVVYTKKTDNPILLAKIAPNGYAAVLTQTEKDAAFVTIYDDMGSVIYTWSSGRRVVDINFCDQGLGCCISTISSSGGKIDSSVYSVMFDSREPVMTCTLADSFVLRTQKLSGGGYIMICDNSVIGVDGNGNQTQRFDFKDQPVSFANSEKYTALYTKSVTGTHGTLMIFDNNSGSVQPTVTQDIQGEPRKIQLEDSTVIAFSSKFVESYDVGGSKLATAQVSRSYVDCVYANKAVYLMGYRDINKIKFDT